MELDSEILLKELFWMNEQKLKNYSKEGYYILNLNINQAGGIYKLKLNCFLLLKSNITEDILIILFKAKN